MSQGTHFAANVVYLLLSWPLHYLSGTLGFLEEGKGKGRENMEVVCGEWNDSIPGLQYYNLLQGTCLSLSSWQISFAWIWSSRICMTFFGTKSSISQSMKGKSTQGPFLYLPCIWLRCVHRRPLWCGMEPGEGKIHEWAIGLGLKNISLLIGAQFSSVQFSHSIMSNSL